jgi:hypothetical protein
MKRIIGVDPGKNGALAFVDEAGRVVVHTTDKVAPLDAMRDALAGAGAENQVVAYLELVGGFIPGRPQPASRAGVLMRSLGKWEGLLEGLGVRYILVRPQAWQAGLPGVAGEKEYARRKRLLRDEAIRRFPQVKVTLENCDALLIADYGRRAEAAVAP